MELDFSLVAPEKELYSGKVDRVDAPGAEGDFGVFAGHEPFMSLLRPGLVVVHSSGHKTVFQIEGGFADVNPTRFTLLAEQVVEVSEGRIGTDQAQDT